MTWQQILNGIRKAHRISIQRNDPQFYRNTLRQYREILGNGTPRFFINDEVMTPDGKGRVKKIEELVSGEIGYTCALEKPYIFTDGYAGIKQYGFPKYSFGYLYPESKLKKLIS